MVTHVIKTVLFALSLSILHCAHAADAGSSQKSANSDGYEPAKGWHFYDLPEEVKKEIDQKIEAEVAKRVSEAMPEPEPGTSEWIKVNLPKVRQRAADDPTAENIRALLLMEKMLKDKARRLSRRVAMIAQTDPILDTSYKATSNMAMARERRVDVRGEKEALFKQMVKEGVALWIFVRGDCGACDRWFNAMERVSTEYGLKILWIIDSQTTIPNPPTSMAKYWEYRVGAGEAEGLGVDSDFSVFAYNQPTDQYVLVSQGFVPFASFLDRIILSADFSGWISPEAVESTMFSVNRFDLSDPDLKGYSGDMSDPVAYSNYIYQKLLEGK